MLYAVTVWFISGDGCQVLTNNWVILCLSFIRFNRESVIHDFVICRKGYNGKDTGTIGT